MNVGKYVNSFELFLAKFFFNSFNLFRFCLVDKFLIQKKFKDYNEEILKNFKNLGFYKIGYISKNKLDILKNFIKDQNQNKSIKHDIFVFNYDFNEEIRKTLKDIVLEDLKPALESLKKFYDNKIFLTHIIMRRTMHVPKNNRDEERFNNFYHIDSYLSNHFKIFVNLSDVKEDCGPTAIFNISESKEICKSNGPFSKRGMLKIEKKPYMNFSQEGGVLLCNTSICLHKASIPAPGKNRDMLVFTFCAYNNPDSNLFFYEDDFYNSIWNREELLTKKLAKPFGYKNLIKFISSYKN